MCVCESEREREVKESSLLVICICESVGVATYTSGKANMNVKFLPHAESNPHQGSIVESKPIKKLLSHLVWSLSQILMEIDSATLSWVFSFFLFFLGGSFHHTSTLKTCDLTL